MTHREVMGPCSSEQRSFWLQSPGLLEASRADARGPEPRILWDFGDRPKDQTLLADPPPLRKEWQFFLEATSWQLLARGRSAVGQFPQR